MQEHQDLRSNMVQQRKRARTKEQCMEAMQEGQKLRSS